MRQKLLESNTYNVTHVDLHCWVLPLPQFHVSAQWLPGRSIEPWSSISPRYVCVSRYEVYPDMAAAAAIPQAPAAVLVMAPSLDGGSIRQADNLSCMATKLFLVSCRPIRDYSMGNLISCCVTGIGTISSEYLFFFQQLKIRRWKLFDFHFDHPYLTDGHAHYTF